MKEKKPFGYKVGYFVGCVFLICVAALISTLLMVPTAKLILWLFSFV